MTDPKDVAEVIETLEDAGFEIVTSNPGYGTCERCGSKSQDTRMGACFVCMLWEDPESTDRELLEGAGAAMQEGLTLDMWLAGRRSWGKLVPPAELVTRIHAAICQHINETVKPWMEAHSDD